MYQRLRNRAQCALFLVLLLPAAIAQSGEPAKATTPDDPALEWAPCPPFFHADCRIAVLHGDPSQSNTDVFFRYPGGESFVEHWHTSAERIVVLAGAMDVTYEGQETAHVEAGTYAYGPATRKHSGACVSEEDCVLFIAFEQPVDAFEVATAATE